MLAGLAARILSIPLIVTMVVAIVTAVWPQLDSARELFGKEELHYIALLTYLVVSGPGAISIDAFVKRWVDAPATGAQVTTRTARA